VGLSVEVCKGHRWEPQPCVAWGPQSSTLTHSLPWHDLVAWQVSPLVLPATDRT